MNDSRATRSSPSKRSTALTVVGAIVLVLGIGGAVIIYEIGQNRSVGQGSSSDGAWQDSSLAPADSKSFSRNVQMYNGTVGVLVTKWWNLCDELKRPGAVAIIVATGSALVAGGCFLAAKRNNGA